MKKSKKFDYFSSLSKGIHKVYTQIDSAMTSFETCLCQYQESFSYLNLQFIKSNNDLKNARLADCFQPIVGMLQQITDITPNALFLDSFQTFYPKYQKNHKNFRDESANISAKAKSAQKSLQKIVQDIVEAAGNSNDAKKLHPALIKFYSAFETEKDVGKNLVIEFATLAMNTVVQMNSLIKDSVETMLKKCSLKNPESFDAEIISIDRLLAKMNEEFNVTYVIQEYVISSLNPVLMLQIGPQKHNLVNFFELENKLNNSGFVKMKEDFVYKGKNADVFLNKGDTLELLYAGYSRLWKVQNSKNNICYVPSTYLSLCRANS